MSEHFPTPEQQPRRRSDASYVFDAIERANSGGEQITSAEARAIASMIKSEGDVALPAFVATGEIDYDTAHFEMAWELGSEDSYRREIAGHLDTYLWVRDHLGDTGPVEGWDKMHLGGES